MPPLDPHPMLVLERGHYFSVEPAWNGLYSLMLLEQAEHLSGLSDWVERTWEQIGADGRHRNRLVMIGLHYAVIPERSFPSFWAYLEYMSKADPYQLRDQLIWHLWSGSARTPVEGELPPPASPADMLISLDHYLHFLRVYSNCGDIDEEIESEAYSYMIDPPRMQRLIVEHLRWIWEGWLQAEWDRQRGLLHESVEAFRQVSFAGLSPQQIVEQVTGRELDQKWQAMIATTPQLVFVPSQHSGPYVGKLRTHSQLIIFYRARLPATSGVRGSALSRSDLLIRLGALTDDTRLRILELLVQNEELCAPEIMLRLDLSQSAVSRHLRQISAAGYITERWHDGSKCYQLNRERINDTLLALKRFLGE
ncbi:MAG: hypothetical protein Fur005_05100 [Roseiflexaceae bacterium]